MPTANSQTPTAKHGGIDLHKILESYSIVPMLIYLTSLLVIVSLSGSPAVQAAFFMSMVLFLLCIGINEAKRYLFLSFLIGIPVAVINPLINQAGATILISFYDLPLAGNINITLEAIIFGTFMSLKLMNTVLVFAVFNNAVHPDRLLNLLSVSASKSALIISVAVRFIPSMVSRFKEIRDIQQTRGVNLESNNLFKNIKNWYPFIKIVLFSTIENSFTTAEAIESRAYGTGKRTVFFSEKIKRRDLVLAADSIIILLVLYLFHSAGLLYYEFFPRLEHLSPEQAVPALLIPALVLVPPLSNWGYGQWKYLKPKI